MRRIKVKLPLRIQKGLWGVRVLKMSKTRK
jgi:hypothetical protein